MVPISMTLSDLWPRFQGHDIIQRQITRKRYNVELYLQWRTNRKSHMVYRTAPFSMTLTPNPRVMVRVRVGKVRTPYPNFQMVPPSMTLSDLWPTFQSHDNIQRRITRLIVSRVWSVHWFRFQWPWVTLNVDFKVTEMPSTNCVRSWRAICLR